MESRISLVQMPRRCGGSLSITRARKSSKKHGGEQLRQTLADPQAPSDDDDLLALDQAPRKPADEDSKAARVVEMHCFAGMVHEDIATALGISVYRARQKWIYARAWLRRELER